MPWFSREDHSMPVIDPQKQIAGKYPEMQVPVLPGKAVVFCLGKGLPVLRDNFSCRIILEKLPGFITHSEVLGLEGYPDVCFLHGGYGAPQIACTVETLRVLGVKEVFLVGLCGGFGENLTVGDLLLPERIWSEEGTSLHYLENHGFAQVSPPVPFDEIASSFRQKGYRISRDATVTTDAVYRQTFHKEQLWREIGCVAVDMEASALVNLCNLYGVKNTVALMVSDRHPLYEGGPAWEWGNLNFSELCERFILDCVEHNMENSVPK